VKLEPNILICGVNWLGDAVMTMPALQRFCEQQPKAHITMLTRPSLVPLWDMHPNVDRTVPLSPDIAGMRIAARHLRQLDLDEAYIFPNSWRSALVPFFARIPHRIGTRGHHRGILLTETTAPSERATAGHQQWEYVDILRLRDIQELPPPTLAIPDSAAQAIDASMPLTPGVRWIGMLPGAARGPSKQWPQAHFVAAAKQIAADHACRFAILGTKSEAPLCNEIQNAIGGAAISLAGRTSLPELIASLGRCDAVLCNDSGGMHLASAVGTKVVAVYGITDATKTGPLGEGHRLIQAKGVTASRDVPRDSLEAREALKSISPERVAEATLDILNTTPSPSAPPE
jgi:heptosyltransferase II